MNPDRWRQIKELFERASSLSPRERQDFLLSECGDDADLLTEVQALLAAEQSDSDEVSDRIRLAADAATGDRRENQLIGPYRIERLLGRGGMGAVYLAQREDGGFEQQVAIKLVASGLATSERQVERFRAERQILARLGHRHIARLYDGGETDQGLPYLVMEFVDGVPIDRWCSELGLDVEQRLRIFLEVCEAVEYAHQNLVVHRDLKPSNILVTGDGEPKLLDFGIARLLASEDQESDASATMHRAMTPDFASPEQVRGEPVTTRTDVYALGLLLYVLLSEQRPYRFSESTQREFERVVCEVEPTLPSRALSESRESPMEHPIAPGQLEGDLDNIVLKALRKEPAERYAGVRELVADVRRFLEGRPVSARPATLRYRVGKFVRRNLTTVAGSAAAVLLLGVLSALYVAGITRERDRAQLEAVKTEQVADFLESLFARSDPSEALGEDLRASELLDRGAKRIEEDLASQPLVQAEMMELIGKVSREIGDYDRSAALLEGSLAKREELLGPSHLETTNAMHQLATTLHETGELERSEQLFRETLRLRRETLAAGDPAILSSLNGLGDLVHTRGDLEEAERLYREALATVDALDESQRGQYAGVYNNMGRVLHDRGELEDAEVYLRDSLAMRKQRYGALHPEVEAAISNLAVLLRDRAKYEEAERLYHESLAAARQLFGEDHPNTAIRLNNLASLLKALGRTDEAIDLQRQALEIFRENFGDEHHRVAMSYNNLANLLHDQGEVEEALALHRRTLDLNEKLYGEEHHLVAGTFANLAVLLLEIGDVEQAEPMMQRALELDRKMLGDEHAYVAGDLDTLAEIALGRGELAEAERTIEESLLIKGKALGEEHPGYATSLAIRGRVLVETGRAAEAEPLLRQAFETHSESLPEGHLNIERTKAELGLCLLELGAVREARDLLGEAEAALRGGGFRAKADADRAAAGLAQL